MTLMALPELKAQKEKLYTVDEYLERERIAVERSEYFDGEIYLMARESDEHGDISVSLTITVGGQLKGQDCRLRTKDAKIKSGGFEPRVGHSTKGMFSYPDLVVICGENTTTKRKMSSSIRKSSSKYYSIRPEITNAMISFCATECLMKR